MTLLRFRHQWLHLDTLGAQLLGSHSWLVGCPWWELENGIRNEVQRYFLLGAWKREQHCFKLFTYVGHWVHHGRCGTGSLQTITIQLTLEHTRALVVVLIISAPRYLMLLSRKLVTLVNLPSYFTILNCCSLCICAYKIVCFKLQNFWNIISKK